MGWELFGTPIVCHHYDLEDALKGENDARMEREDNGAPSDDEEMEIEEPSATRRATVPASSSLPMGATASRLSGKQRKKQKKRERERANHRERRISSLNSLTAPTPSPRILEKAATAIPIHIGYNVENFRATQQRNICPTLTGLEMNPTLSLTARGRVIGVLIAPPEDWDTVVDDATDAFRHARMQMSFPESAFLHRRATGPGFPSSTKGFGFGNGRKGVGNYKPRSQKNSVAMDELFGKQRRPANGNVSLSDYHETKQTLLQRNPHLDRTFRGSPFTAITANLGPFSVCPPHLDCANKADGMCLISALGRFNADKGAHLVLWDYNFMVRFPAGRSALIPSAVVTHSNTLIADDEERFSLLQYSAEALFRWVDNGFQSDVDWHAAATAADVERREEARKTRCASALKKFSLWKDIKVKNYSGRARVEVWDQGDMADFSDLTEESDVETPPRKKRRT
ncbi:hypothetical protein MSAN_01805800 [Mycena sanguinolenta]|uniref:Uncharacterized protein n=1 Tax=Mycena sanguinolenta TaxID=230812 RepID=A0A8H6XRG4_9AGAR|nr:hypothetical protein MSAN_01805800 [Mycena sanguinolenta]